MLLMALGTNDGAAKGPECLTPREREVACLVARGYTNREIADELELASGSAANHVEHIRRKLGFKSRTQIAAWVCQHGLNRRGEEG